MLTHKQSIAFNATEALKVTDCDIQGEREREREREEEEEDEDA